jgi:uncharacterized membrane protein YhaH (DUF805 family)
MLFVALCLFAGTLADSYVGIEFRGEGVVSSAVLVCLLIPTATVTVRRLHDTDDTGWWALLAPSTGIPGSGWTRG